MKLALVLAAVVTALPITAAADDLDFGADPWSPKLRISGTDKQKPSTSNKPSRRDQSTARNPRPTTDCSLTSAGLADCVAQYFGNAPAPTQATLTPGRIQRAVREIPMPRLRLTIEPANRTLVNIPTILHTRPTTLHRTLTLLGHDIQVHATPTRYTWHHGDGTHRTTRTPGKPYPAKTITHRYRHTAEHLNARVDVTYTVRYRIDHRGWTNLADTLTATGPTTTLQVTQRAPALVER